MAAPNPLESTHNGAHEQPRVSQSTYTIAGITTHVHGLEELPPQPSSVACLWLLHPRLQTHQCMAPIAAQAIHAWNARQSGSAGAKGLIAVSFDQRNHGSRQVDPVANEAWRNGNPRHAQDMFSIYHGTATDTSLLLSYLPAYISLTPSQHLVLGISLGGHATWHCVLHEPRISTAVSIIGCPDYTALMQQRAEKSKLQTWTSSEPAGSGFIGSSDFPQALVEAVRQWDPAGSLMRRLSNPEAPSPVEMERLRAHLWANLQGKRLLNLSGGADKLVPYACGEGFLQFLKNTVQDDPRLAFELEDLVFDGVGHETTPKMAEIAVNFICDSLASERPVTSRVKTSKI
ncbi:Alpha/Beta hydrolase protein [Phyllosticta capitalensis]